MTDVLCFFSPDPAGKTVYGHVIPIGLACIASVLEQNNYSVKIIDLQVEDVDIKEVLRHELPYLVCISDTTGSRFESFKIAKTVKEVSKEIVVSYGGPHATFTAEDTLTNIREIDVVVISEGEFTVLELAKVIKKGNINYSDLLGISYRDSNGIRHNTYRPRISDLDRLPLPARHLFNRQKYNIKMDFINVPGDIIITSRGCPYKCSFCSAAILWNNKYTHRSASNVCMEIEFLIDKYRIEGIKFFDSTFTINRKFVLSICQEFKARGLDGMPWECEIRADTVDYELLKIMKEAGCYYINMGLESASPRVLKTINKGITVEQVENVIRWANALQIHTKLFLTYAHPGETLKDIKMTLKFREKYKDRVSFFAEHVGIMIYPGTEVERYARDNGLLPPGFCWSSPFEQKINERFSTSTRVPLLFQHQLGHREMANINYRITWAEYTRFGYIIKKILAIRSFSDLIRYWNSFKSVVMARWSLLFFQIKFKGIKK